MLFYSFSVLLFIGFIYSCYYFLYRFCAFLDLLSLFPFVQQHLFLAPYVAVVSPAVFFGPSRLLPLKTITLEHNKTKILPVFQWTFRGNESKCVESTSLSEISLIWF